SNPQSDPTEFSHINGDAEDSKTRLQMSAQLENTKRLTKDASKLRSHAETAQNVPVLPSDPGNDVEDWKYQLQTSVNRKRSKI
ncbi:hypothetical protein V8B97DRAFT_1855019, partial [Scleroderma yunnanense]